MMKPKIIKCEFTEDISVFDEIPLEQLLSIVDATYTCDSEDGKYQIYAIDKKCTRFVRVLKEDVIAYLESREEKGNEENETNQC